MYLVYCWYMWVVCSDLWYGTLFHFVGHSLRVCNSPPPPHTHNPCVCVCVQSEQSMNLTHPPPPPPPPPFPFKYQKYLIVMLSYILQQGHYYKLGYATTTVFPCSWWERPCRPAQLCWGYDRRSLCARQPQEECRPPTSTNAVGMWLVQGKFAFCRVVRETEAVATSGDFSLASKS